jgi:hypothetical protein
MKLQDIIRRASEIGTRTGFITFDQLNELCPREFGPLDIEALMAALGDEAIHVTDGAAETSDPLLVLRKDSAGSPAIDCGPARLHLQRVRPTMGADYFH